MRFLKYRYKSLIDYVLTFASCFFIALFFYLFFYMLFFWFFGWLLNVISLQIVAKDDRNYSANNNIHIFGANPSSYNYSVYRSFIVIRFKSFKYYEYLSFYKYLLRSIFRVVMKYRY